MRFTRTACRMGAARAACGGCTPVLAVAAILVAGCSTAAGPAPRPGMGQLHLAGLSTAQARKVDTALQELEQRCMTKTGFRFRVSPQDEASSPEAGGDSNPLLVDISALRARGYGMYQATLPPSSPAQRQSPADPNAAYLESLSPAHQARWNAAFDGTAQTTVTLPDDSQSSFPANGCSAKAAGELYGNAEAYYTLQDYASNLISRIGIQATWTAVWRHAQTAWRRCMAAHGYRYQNETAARLVIYARYQAPGVNRARTRSYELRVAAQDADCATTSQIPTAAHTAVRQAAASLTPGQVPAVLAWARMQAHALAKADGTLSHAGDEPD